jgi:hypothetical protein
MPKKINIYIIYGLILLGSQNVYSQITFNGKVCRADSTPLDQVIVLKTGSTVGSLTGRNGAFLLSVDSSAQIIFRRIGFISDTLFMKNYLSQLQNGKIYITKFLTEKPITLNTFTFMQRRPIRVDPYEKKQQWNYVLERPKASLSSPITALYEQFGKKGREFRKLEELYYADERKRKMEERFSRLDAIFLTGLKGRSLDAYLASCTPSYEMMMSLSDYELIIYMKDCFDQYKQLHPEILTPNTIEPNDTNSPPANPAH